MQKFLLFGFTVTLLAITAGSVYSQVDTSPPNIVDTNFYISTVTNQRCDTYWISMIFSNTCDLLGQGGPNTTINILGTNYSLSICDSHCRCTHGAQWGKCIARDSKEMLMMPIIARTSLMCKCYYSRPPAGTPVNNNLLDTGPGFPITLFGNAYCEGWYATPFAFKYIDRYCELVSNNATSGNCNTDCVCSHGFNYGRCTRDKNCTCYYRGGAQSVNGV